MILVPVVLSFARLSVVCLLEVKRLASFRPDAWVFVVKKI